ncbi:MAG: hypothetical protein JO081_19680 [Alphaproteobacteria bacterium]|nr:hypothetical protein [Alphaproteobacteria bacterium]
MGIRSVGISAACVAALVALPLSTAKSQYYYPPPCSPFPLFWPFCIAGAVVGTAAIIVTAPFRALTGAPPLYYGYYWPSYYPSPGYNGPGYYAPPNYYAPR